MEIVFDLQSSFISKFRMRTLILKNEMSGYGIEMKLTHLVKSKNTFLSIHIKGKKLHGAACI